MKEDMIAKLVKSGSKLDMTIFDICTGNPKCFDFIEFDWIASTSDCWTLDFSEKLLVALGLFYSRNLTVPLKVLAFQKKKNPTWRCTIRNQLGSNYLQFNSLAFSEWSILNIGGYVYCCSGGWRRASAEWIL